MVSSRLQPRLIAHPVLYEKDGDAVAHVKCTFLVLKNGNDRITTSELQEVESDKKLAESLYELIATELKPKRSRRTKSKYNTERRRRSSSFVFNEPIHMIRHRPRRVASFTTTARARLHRRVRRHAVVPAETARERNKTCASVFTVPSRSSAEDILTVHDGDALAAALLPASTKDDVFATR